VTNPHEPLAYEQQEYKGGGFTRSKLGLCDPDDRSTQLILWLYSIEPPFYAELNKACREMNRELLETLGPISYALFLVV